MDLFDTPSHLISSGVTIVPTGGMIFLTACAIYWSMRGIKGLWSPGVWLSVCGAMQFVHAVISVATYVAAPSQEGLLLTGWMGFSLADGCAVLFGAIAIRSMLPWNWRVAFAFFAAGRLIEAVFASQFYLLQGEGWVPYWIVPWLAAFPTSEVGPLVVAFAIITDSFRRRKRPWPHWIGTALWSSELAIQEAMYRLT